MLWPLPFHATEDNCGHRLGYRPGSVPAGCFAQRDPRPMIEETTKLKRCGMIRSEVFATSGAANVN
jgi:hypothetical protein